MTTLFDLESPPPQPPQNDYWLQLLEQKLGAEPRLHNRLRPNTCKKCNTWILEGYDAPLLAKHVQLRPKLCTPQQETACVLLNIPTYQLHGPPGTWTITPRFEPDLPPAFQMKPAHDVPVLHEHRCNLPIATQWLPRSNTSTTDFNQPPPF